MALGSPQLDIIKYIYISNFVPDRSFPTIFSERAEFRLFELNWSLKYLVISRTKERDLFFKGKGIKVNFGEWGREKRTRAHAIVRGMHNFLCIFLGHS
jgi:hypothetical protein